MTVKIQKKKTENPIKKSIKDLNRHQRKYTGG